MIGSDAEPRDVKINVSSVIDMTSDDYKGKKIKAKVFIPLLLYDYGKWMGPIFTEGNSKLELDDDSVTFDVERVINNTIEASGLFSGSGKEYDLKVEILDFYGMYYKESVGYALIAVGGNTTYNFLPTGFVNLKLLLVDSETSEIIDESYISESYLFSKELITNMNWYSSYDFIGQSTVQVALQALSEAVYRIPGIVDHMLAELDEEEFTIDGIDEFMIVRITSEYDFVEKVLIDYETGTIISDEIVELDGPIYSKPDEWVVAPYLNDHYLSDSQYEQLIVKLQDKYDVDFQGNLSAATFFGVLEK